MSPGDKPAYTERPPINYEVLGEVLKAFIPTEQLTLDHERAKELNRLATKTAGAIEELTQAIYTYLGDPLRPRESRTETVTHVPKLRELSEILRNYYNSVNLNPHLACLTDTYEYMRPASDRVRAKYFLTAEQRDTLPDYLKFAAVDLTTKRATISHLNYIRAALIEKFGPDHPYIANLDEKVKGLIEEGYIPLYFNFEMEEELINQIYITASLVKELQAVVKEIPDETAFDRIAKGHMDKVRMRSLKKQLSRINLLTRRIIPTLRDFENYQKELLRRGALLTGAYETSRQMTRERYLAEVTVADQISNIPVYIEVVTIGDTKWTSIINVFDHRYFVHRGELRILERQGHKLPIVLAKNTLYRRGEAGKHTAVRVLNLQKSGKHRNF